MDRRLFLFSAVALGACTPGATDSRLQAVCDREFAGVIRRAFLAWRTGAEEINIIAVAVRDVADVAMEVRSAVVVTREALHANRLQRLAHVRLERRWQVPIGGARAEVMVTTGQGTGQWGALAFAQWLASPAAAPHLKDMSSPPEGGTTVP